MYATHPVALAQDIRLVLMPDDIMATVSTNLFRALIPKNDFPLAVEKHNSGAENLEC